VPVRLVGRFDLCALQASKVSPGTPSPCSSTPAARQLRRRGAGIGPAGRYKGVVKSGWLSWATWCVCYVRYLCYYWPTDVCLCWCPVGLRARFQRLGCGHMGWMEGWDARGGWFGAGCASRYCAARSASADMRCSCDVPGRPDMGDAGTCYVSLLTRWFAPRPSLLEVPKNGLLPPALQRSLSVESWEQRCGSLPGIWGYIKRGGCLPHA